MASWQQVFWLIDLTLDLFKLIYYNFPSTIRTKLIERLEVKLTQEGGAAAPRGKNNDSDRLCCVHPHQFLLWYNWPVES